jgi:hypothetical protein
MSFKKLFSINVRLTILDAAYFSFFLLSSFLFFLFTFINFFSLSFCFSCSRLSIVFLFLSVFRVHIYHLLLFLSTSTHVHVTFFMFLSPSFISLFLSFCSCFDTHLKTNLLFSVKSIYFLVFLLPCLFLIKLKKYHFGKVSIVEQGSIFES